MDDPITIELLDSANLAFVGQPFPLNLVIRCPLDGKETVLRSIRSRDRTLADLDTDLFERDVTIRPGEVYRCTVVATFFSPGTVSEPPFVIIAGHDTYGRAVRLPTPQIRVVPSLLNEIRPRAEAICTYECSTKVDVTLEHIGRTRFDDLRLTVGPATALRAGVSDQRRPAFAQGEQVKFTTVVESDVLSLELNATVQGERVGPVAIRLPVPPVRDVSEATLFRFLEPKKLTQAEVRLFSLDEERAETRPTSGVFTVYGGGERYRVDIKPAHPHVQNVKLRGVSGVVEVTEMPADPGTWSFQLVVVSNAVFTTSATLQFDVLTPDGAQQGELNLSIRPRNTKLWIVAVTAGAAVTVKGVAAVVPAILTPSDPLAALQAALMKINALWDLLQLLSIPVIRVGLWLADKILRPLQDD